VDLSAYRDVNVWMEIELQPTIYGRLRQLLYQPAGTQLTMWDNDDLVKPATFRAPAAMLSAGFLVNPVLANNNDAVNLFRGNKGRSANAFSVTVEATMVDAWQPEIHFRIYRIGR